MNDTHLSFKKTRKVQGDHHEKDQTFFSVCCLKTCEQVWEIANIERIFYKADARIDDDCDIVIFGEVSKKPDEDSGSQEEPSKPEKILIVQKKTEETEIEKDDDDGILGAVANVGAAIVDAGAAVVDAVTGGDGSPSLDKKKSQKPPTKEVAEPEAKKEMRKYFRVYEIEFGEEFDGKADDAEDKLKFETHIVENQEKKEKKDKKHGKKDKDEKKELMGLLGGKAYNVGLNTETIKPKKKAVQ